MKLKILIVALVFLYWVAVGLLWSVNWKCGAGLILYSAVHGGATNLYRQLKR